MLSEVADITGIVKSPVKVFFGTKMLEGSAPPGPVFVRRSGLSGELVC